MRRALLLSPLVAAVAVFLLLSESGRGRAREPVPRARDARAGPAIECAVAGEDAPEPAPAAISGTVRDGLGQPFAGARVRIFPGSDPDAWTDAPPPLEEPLSSLETLADGRFAATARAGRPLLVVADAPECVPALATVRAGLAAADLELTLLPGARQRIRVVDGDGRPLAGAEALVFQRGETLRACAAADEQGWIDLDLAPRELLVVRAPGFAWELLEPPVDLPEVALEREYRLGGIVVFADGTPAKGARISFDRYLWREEIVTGHDGRFLAGGLGESELDITVRPTAGDYEVLRVQPGDEALRIVLPTASVEGVVLMPDKRPAKGASVSIAGSGTTCDDDGRFLLREVDPGTHDLRASLEDLVGSAEVRVGARDVTGVRVVLGGRPRPPRSLVRISAVDVLGAPVAAQGQVYIAGQRETWWKVGSAGGAAELAQPPGTDVVVFGGESDPPRGTLRASGAVAAVTDGPPVTLRLQPPVAVTVVLHGPDGAPIGGESRLSLSGIEHRALDGGGPGCHRLLLRAGDPGPADLTIRAPGYAPRRIAGWKPPPAGGDVPIRLEPAVRITGHVSLSGAAQAEPLRILLEGESSFEEHESGRFRYDVAPGAKVSVVAARGAVPGFATTIEVPVRGVVDLGSIRIDEPWTLRGTVVDESGAPVGGAIVTVSGPCHSARTATRGDGSFRLLSPPSDLYAVAAEKGPFSSDPRPASALLRRAEPLRLAARR